jgi:hypothetical protein
MVPGPNGYMMVAEDGGIFSFGDVQFHGSLGNNPPSSPITAVSLWNRNGGFRPAAVYEWVDVDLNADPNYTAISGYATGGSTGLVQSIPFTITGAQ